MAAATATRGAASYCRFSSQNQDDRTIADQQRQCGERAARDGFLVDKCLEFADEAISGASHSRGGFDRMMAAAREGRIKILYFVNLSRLARDCVLTLQTLRELVYVHKVRVISIDEALDTSQGDSWELIAAILGIQHEQFLKKLAKDVFRGQEGVVLDHYCVGDYCFGFSSEPVPGTEGRGKGRNKLPKTSYTIDLIEAGWVVKIFYWFVVERQSLRWIVRELNKLGAPKDHRATTPYWHHELVAKLLKNRKYLGWWPWGENKNVRDPLTRKVKQEKRPIAETEKWLRHFPELQLIDDETFAKAQELLKENADRNTNHRHANGQLLGSSRASHDAHPRHLLSGLMECECGRKLNIGGSNGRYLFCRGHGMGVCKCPTTLRRDLAERLILQAIGERILANPVWVDLLLDMTRRSYERLRHEAPEERRALEAGLADVNKRIASLVANCENQVVPELDARMTELRDQRENYQSKLAVLDAKAGQSTEPPTRDLIEEKLRSLQDVLRAGGPAAAHALRALVGGKIVVSEVRRPGKKRHYLRGRLELRLRAVAAAVGSIADEQSNDDPAATEVVVIDFRKPDRHEVIADEVKRLWDDGVPDKEICQTFRCSRTLLSGALDFWHESRGLERPDGRSAKKRKRGPRKADKLQPQIMELYFDDVPIMVIADKLDCSPEQVREAVEMWHRERNLPVPDGRARRREIRRKRRAG